MSAELSDVMDSVVKAVNIVKKSALRTRLLLSLCCCRRRTYCATVSFWAFVWSSVVTCVRVMHVYSGIFTLPKQCRAGCKRQNGRFPEENQKMEGVSQGGHFFQVSISG